MHIKLLLLAVATMVSGPFSAPAAAQQAAGIRYADIPANAYSIVAEVRAKPGKETELREATLPLIALVRSDPKTLIYFLQEDRAAPGHFIFYEVFASVGDFEAHNAMPYVREWFAKLPLLAEGGVQVMRMEVLRGDGSGIANLSKIASLPIAAGVRGLVPPCARRRAGNHPRDFLGPPVALDRPEATCSAHGRHARNWHSVPIHRTDYDDPPAFGMCRAASTEAW